MKNIGLFLLFFLAFISSAEAQHRTTYPVDSCLYFMDPFQFKILGTTSLPNGGQGNVTIFRSSGTPDLYVMGQGGFITFQDQLPPGVTIKPDDTGQLLLTVPEQAENADSWPGGQPPFPLFLYGFLKKIGTTVFDPPLPVTVRATQIFLEDTTQ
jgi:hypothetical protein